MIPRMPDSERNELCLGGAGKTGAAPMDDGKDVPATGRPDFAGVIKPAAVRARGP